MNKMGLIAIKMYKPLNTRDTSSKPQRLPRFLVYLKKNKIKIKNM